MFFAVICCNLVDCCECLNKFAEIKTESGMEIDPNCVIRDGKCQLIIIIYHFVNHLHLRTIYNDMLRSFVYCFICSFNKWRAFGDHDVT